MAAPLTADQEQATKHFLDTVNQIRGHRRAAPVSWTTAVKFLVARKFDVARAVSLFEQNEAIRRAEGLMNFDPTKEPLKSELKTGKFTILPTRDSSGAAIAVFTARYHQTQTSTHQTTLQGVLYQLDAALENVDTQRCGLVFIYDMTESKYSNFDYDLSQKILTLLKGGYPAKLKKVLIVTAPLWFKAPFKILRLFVREKLRDRVYTVSLPQLSVHIPRGALPISLGGTVELRHDDWLVACSKLQVMNNNATYGDGGDEPVRTSAGPAVTNGSAGGTNHHAGHSDTEGSPLPPPSSASSGFSDDDSLHADPTGTSSSQGLSIAEFVEAVRSKGRSGLCLEYTEIKTKPPDGSFEVAKRRENQSKNRYTDVLAYDHTRVLLSLQDDVPGSDYINANFVDGYKQKNAFISTQGPMPKTVEDFWRMVWEQQSLVIIMTTRVMERGRNKCAQYWPGTEGMEMTHGDFLVTTECVTSSPDYTLETRMVAHYQFTAWPDYGVPESALSMLEFLAKARHTQAALLADLGDTWAGHPRGPPIIVHCSAGIGRTGTLCTLDICISRLEDSGTVDVRGTVERIRSQRAYSIQMPDQYIFCHLALIEYALSRGLISAKPDLSGFQTSDSDTSE
ncbi:hypothetical protein M8J75_010766 [Diaphorina citri]|nr:hypothetical protein M8J75_010766 [Diaphorina citri]